MLTQIVIGHSDRIKVIHLVAKKAALLYPHQNNPALNAKPMNLTSVDHSHYSRSHLSSTKKIT